MTLASEDLITARTGFEDQQLLSRMGISITRCDRDRVEGTMPVAGNRQPIGILHGGANAVLAETLGSLAALVYADASNGGQAVGLELSCTHHRWVLSGVVRGVCTPLHQGLTAATYAIDIVDETGRLTCSARLTCSVVRAHTTK
ncbi:hotdog fold thioesterase [Rhodococcus sp. G-MC3]|uniref:hotdog fold thioesterase n=1 Tax=Rhodococcus sp. G-MC3 TaxID=3046209 RepID=UPI0024B996E0|nr:hotdog fold thioesterase [Rhodococcus sp. G-MC3]MDJ0396710.1 hotdog fold thioesterase [Rhodococcus sp. G-MC3]